MKNLKTRKVLAFCMAAAMMAGVLGSCGGDTESSAPADGSETTAENSGGETSGDGDYVDLIWLSSGSAINEEDTSLVIQELAKQTGIMVQHNYVPTEKWQVLMASGDMEADILEVPAVDRQTLIEGGLIQPLDDLIAEYGPNIQKTMSQRTMDYWAKYVSYGRDQLYILSSHQAPDMEVVYDSVPYNYGVAPYIRWDYYEELGSPEVNNEDDLLNVLKQMQDAHPTNDLGRKTYAMSLEVTAGIWSYATMYSYYNGFEAVGPAYMVSRDTEDTLHNMLEEDYVLWGAARYYNKAWQLGILDPETFTQKGENVTEKISNSQAFYTENSWNNYNTVLGESVGPEAGFEPILEAFPYAYAGGTSQFGWGFATAITSTTEHAEDAMKFLDYLYSEEGARLCYSGIEGVHWEYDADGVPAYTQETLDNRGNTEWDKANGLNKFGNWIGIDNMVPASDGYPVDLSQMPSMLKANNKALDEHYCELYGVEYPGQVGKVMEEEREGYKVVWWNGDIGSLMQVVPDDINRLATQVTDIMIKAFPKMIMSDTDEEFEKEKADCMQQIKDAGAQDIIDWVYSEWERCKEELGTL